MILVKSECDFVGCGVVGWCVEVSVIISFQCLNTWYSSAGYGYSTGHYGVFQ